MPIRVNDNRCNFKLMKYNNSHAQNRTHEKNSQAHDHYKIKTVFKSAKVSVDCKL